MKNMRILAACVLLGTATALPGGVSASTLVVGAPGDPDTGNCFPFGCIGWDPEYQQVYASSDFSGSITITGLVFYNNNFVYSGEGVNSGEYVIALSTTTTPVDGLDLSDLNDNLGPDLTNVFKGQLPGLAGNELAISFNENTFDYEPADGNLLLSVYASPSDVSANGGIYLDADFGDSGGLFSRAMTPGCCSEFNDTGLVTGFVTAPEPLTLSLFGAGIAGIAAGAVRRRRKNGRSG